MTESDTARAFADLVRLVVDRPEDVSVEESYEEGVTVLRLSAAEEDLGKVIGRQGRTARALRTLLAARADRVGERIELEILDD